MSRILGWIRRFIRELRRRRVIRVAVVYAGTGFVLLELADIVQPALQLPSWTVRFILFLLALGFPLAVGLAWVYNITEEGLVQADAEGDRGELGPESKPFTSDAVIVGLLALLAGLLLYPRVFSSGEESSGQASSGAVAPDTAEQEDRQREEVASGTERSFRTEKEPRVAVLPFENLARDSTDAFFARGMHEEVLSQLSKVSGLEVLSRTSVMQYRDTQKPVPTISEELGGVDALEGSVRRAGDQVRITTQLIGAPKDEHLWSRTYDRTLSPDAVFDIQADIAEQIASALETELTKGERRRIEEAPTSDLAAYDAYLKGRSARHRAWGTANPADVDRVIRHLRKAVRRDSTFAEARGVLAQAYVLRFVSSGKNQWVDSARTEADRALALEPDLPEALHAQAQIYRRRDSLQAAEELYRRILEHEPNNVGAIEGMNDVASERDDPVEQVRWSHRAVQLEPRAPFYVSTMGFALLDAGMWDPAAAWFRRAVELGPDRVWSHFGLALARAPREPSQSLKTMQAFLDVHPNHPLALTWAGRMAFLADQSRQTKAYLKRFPEAQKKFYSEDSPSRPDQMGLGTEQRIWLGLSELRLGQKERGRQLLRRAADSLKGRLERGSGAPDWRQIIHLAGVLGALNKDGEALRRLEQGLRRTTPEIPSLILLSSPFFGDLRSAPRFEQIVRQVEARRTRVREEVRQLGIDLYPPGAKPKRARTQPQTDA